MRHIYDAGSSSFVFYLCSKNYNNGNVKKKIDDIYKMLNVIMKLHSKDFQ